MTMDNENKKLSRSRKRRIERKFELDDKMKSLLNKNEFEMKKKNKTFDKIKILEIESIKFINAINPKQLPSDSIDLNKIQVVDKKLHENKGKILVDHTGEFEMVGSLKVGDQICQTYFSFRNITDYEAYINSIDKGYDAEDSFINCYFYKINTPQINSVDRSQYGNGLTSNMKFMNIKEIIV